MACPICHDTGWKYVGSEDERRVTRCECRLRSPVDRLLHAARIPKRYQHCEIENFDILPGASQQMMSRARFIAGRFVEEYPLDRNQGLVFLGPVGVGKTHLAVGVLRELMRSKGVQGLFWDYRELLKSIQDSYNPSVEITEMEILRPVFEAELLLLDELGAIKPTEWIWNTVSLILNSRYNNQLTTLITSNLADLPPRDPVRSAAESSRSSEVSRYAAQAPTLGDRITEPMRSRLHEMCRVVEMNGIDWRTRIKEAAFTPQP